MRKTRGIFGILCVVFCMALLLVPARAEAASAKSKALKAYKQFLSQDSISWNYNTATLSKCKFALAYIDNDAIPELIINSGSDSNIGHVDGYYQLYAYKNGEVIHVANLYDNFVYYKKKGIFINTYQGGTRGCDRSYLQYVKGSAKTKFYVYDEVAYGSDANSDGEIKNSYTKVIKWNDDYTPSSTKTITKSAFNKQLKKLVGSKKQTTPKYYENTAANRKKYLK